MSSQSIWHRFPKNDYEYLKNILKKLIDFEEDQIARKEKKEVSQLIRLIEKGFKEKKDLNLKLNFLIECVEFYLAVHQAEEKNSIKLREVLKKFYSYKSRGGVA